jgi:hypothetical protein
VLRGPHPTLVTAGGLPDAPVPAGVRTARITPGPGAAAWGEGYLRVRPEGHFGLATLDAADLAPYPARSGHR